MILIKHGRPIPTILDLLGASENDMTASLAHVLAASPCFLTSVAKELTGSGLSSVANAIVQIQTARRSQGITDIELDASPDLFAVFEAKRGAELPSLQQLTCYAPIVANKSARTKLLVTVSNAAMELARIHYRPMAVCGTPLVHLPWRLIHQLAEKSRSAESNANKILLDNFRQYLGAILGMENKYSNMVYVVSLSSDVLDGWKLSWIDVVEKQNAYFYPASGGWPDPPNYLGFRYGGKLQSIRKVLSFKVVHDLRDELPGAKKEDWGPLYFLRLGTPIVPPHEVKNGPQILRANRCWCMIDTLLTFPTISDALAETKRREAAQI